jgi:hypothetical protein
MLLQTEVRGRHSISSNTKETFLRIILVGMQTNNLLLKQGQYKLSIKVDKLKIYINILTYNRTT